MTSAAPESCSACFSSPHRWETRSAWSSSRTLSAPPPSSPPRTTDLNPRPMPARTGPRRSATHAPVDLRDTTRSSALPHRRFHPPSPRRSVLKGRIARLPVPSAALDGVSRLDRPQSRMTRRAAASASTALLYPRTYPTCHHCPITAAVRPAPVQAEPTRRGRHPSTPADSASQRSIRPLFSDRNQVHGSLPVTPRLHPRIYHTDPRMEAHMKTAHAVRSDLSDKQVVQRRPISANPLLGTATDLHPVHETIAWPRKLRPAGCRDRPRD